MTAAKKINNRQIINYARGFEIHPIQARKAMEDRDAWRAGKLVHIGKKSVDVEVEGVAKRYVCHHAPDVSAALAAGQPYGEGHPNVVVIEAWSVLLLPLGKKGKRLPEVIGFFPTAAKLVGGTATEVLTSGKGCSLNLYSIKAPGRRVLGKGKK